MPFLGKFTDPVVYSRRLAASEQDFRYPHHIWLRALISFPELGDEIRTAYLQQSHQWQSGKDHPWGLIETYRAWLLLINGEIGKANEHMLNAIALCSAPSNGPVLLWMAEVIRTLAKSLGLDEAERPSEERRNSLQKLLPAAPHEALSRFASADGNISTSQILGFLKECLPFNFH